jgi:hypothetical protein
MAILRMGRGLILAAALALPILFGCRVDLPHGPDGPDAEFHLRRMWPNKDGFFWSYRYTLRSYGDTGTPIYYLNEEDVPPIPSFDELEEFLGYGPPLENVEPLGGSLRLEFDGELTTASGATGQWLKSTVSMSGAEPSSVVKPTDTFLERLAACRPDLREKIVSLGYLEERQMPASGAVKTPFPFLNGGIQVIGPSPLLLHGGAWERTDEYIGMYGDLDQLLAWKFLEADLSVGHEFTHKLVPSLSNDVFLHCKIISHESRVTTLAGVFRDAVVCLYVIDFGVALLHTYEPVLDQFFRVYSYGTVTYVRDVGPVASYERLLVYAGDSNGMGVGDGIIGVTNLKVRDF